MLVSMAAVAYVSAKSLRHYRLRIWDPTSHGVELPRKAAYRPRVLDARELKSMLRGLWGRVAPAVEAVAIIGSCLGARRGEACAVDLARSVDWRPDEVARTLRSACRRLGLPHVPPKQLRHTWATLAVEAGVSIETVAMMLGHTGISMAYEHYIVSRRSICREAQRRVEALLVAA